MEEETFRQLIIHSSLIVLQTIDSRLAFEHPSTIRRHVPAERKEKLQEQEVFPSM